MNIAEVASLRAQLWNVGLRPVPVYTVAAGKRLGHDKPGKHPFGNKWQVLARENPPYAVKAAPQTDTLNTGILADGLRPIDIDIDNPTIAQSCASLAYEMLGDAPIRFRANSSRRTILYRAAQGEPSKQTITGNLGKIEVLGKGQQFVAFGDHESGATLQWAGETPGTVDAASIPAVTEQQVNDYLARCAQIIGAKPPKHANDHDHSANPDKQADTLLIGSALAFVPNDGPPDWDEWKRIAMAIWAATGGNAVGWDLFSAWSARNPAYDADETREQWDVLRTSPPNDIGAGTIFYIAEQHGWKRPAPTPAKGKPKRHTNTLALVNVITTHQTWQNSLRLNRFTETIEVSDSFPAGGASYRPIREPGDVLDAMLWFQGHGFPKAGKNLVIDALCASASQHAYHPVQRYLDGLKWDGTECLGKLFQHYFNAEIPEGDPEGDHEAQDHAVSYLEHTSKCWMISAVARVRRPGCKVDHVPILLSLQNYNKSKAVRTLCPDPAWFAEDLSTELGQRDTKESLNGKWIFELSEFPHARKEVDRVKAFFSKQTDRYRRAYDRLTQDWPRQCVFIATTNDLEFIDPTGSRRFWPFEVAEPINVEPIEADRDQLWAEAVHLFNDGYQWWLPITIELIANEQQEQFEEEDIWTSELADHISKNALTTFTLADVMTGALRFPAATEIKKPDQMRAGQCLKSLGYRRKRVRTPGQKKPQWLWKRAKL